MITCICHPLRYCSILCVDTYHAAILTSRCLTPFPFPQPTGILMSKRFSDSCRSILCYRLGGGACLAVGGQLDGARVSGAEGTLIFAPVSFSPSSFFHHVSHTFFFILVLLSTISVHSFFHVFLMVYLLELRPI